MRLDHYSYLARRLATVRSAELVHRAALWIRRRRDRLLFALDPKRTSIESILASRNTWLAVQSGTVRPLP